MGMSVATPLWELPAHPPLNGPRYLAVHLPAFRLERCGWGAGDCVALVAERRSATRLVALTPAAREAGLHEEMTAAEARSLVAGIVLEPLDEAGEEEDRCALLRAFESLCDRVRRWDDETLVLEVSATSALHGGEQRLMERVRALAEELGHACRLALSDHPIASAALATWLRIDTLVPVGRGAAALERLPITALWPSETLLQALQTLGVHTVGAWARLDAASVSGRFGEEGHELHRVALGLPATPWTALPSTAPIERLHLVPEEEVEQVAALILLVRRGLEQLQQTLRARDEGLACLELRLELDRGTPELIRLRIGRPTSCPDTLIRLLSRRFEALALQSPVTRVVLHAREVVSARSWQEDLLERREAVEALPDLLARLEDVLGEQAVVQAVLVSDWRPERAWTTCPAHGLPPPPLKIPKIDPVEVQEGRQWATPRARPTLLRQPPQPIRVRTDPQGRPVELREERGWWRFPRVEGPERLEGGWWEAEGGYGRSYWVVGLVGGTGWIFEERSQWFLHGWFD
jgi:protein ImuB